MIYQPGEAVEERIVEREFRCHRDIAEIRHRADEDAFNILRKRDEDCALQQWRCAEDVEKLRDLEAYLLGISREE